MRPSRPSPWRNQGSCRQSSHDGAGESCGRMTLYRCGTIGAAEARLNGPRVSDDRSVAQARRPSTFRAHRHGFAPAPMAGDARYLIRQAPSDPPTRQVTPGGFFMRLDRPGIRALEPPGMLRGMDQEIGGRGPRSLWQACNGPVLRWGDRDLDRERYLPQVAGMGLKRPGKAADAPLASGRCIVAASVAPV